MLSGPLSIVAVSPRKPSGFFVIEASDGTRYATKDPLKASLCSQAEKQQLPVRIDSCSGWFYRNLTLVELVA